MTFQGSGRSYTAINKLQWQVPGENIYIHHCQLTHRLCKAYIYARGN